MSLKKVKYIDLVFENCGSAKIDIKDISNFGIGRIWKEIHACNITDVDIHYFCEYAFICIYDLKNLKFKEFKQVEEKLLYERLKKFNDITYFGIIYEDNTNDYITVPWLSKCQYRNFAQEVKFLRTGYDCNTEEEKDIYFIEFIDKWNIKKIFRYLLFQFKVLKFKIKKRIFGYKI